MEWKPYELVYITLMILSEDLSTDNCFLDNYVMRVTSS